MTTKRRPRRAPGYADDVQPHLVLGAALRTATNEAWRVVSAYGPSSREGQAAERLVRQLERFCSVMDDALCREVPPERDPRRLATCVYYGEVRPAPTLADPNDAFTGWTHALNSGEPTP